jgi:hypothetical protein
MPKKKKVRKRARRKAKSKALRKVAMVVMRVRRKPTQ